MIAAAVGALAGGCFGTLLLAGWRLTRRQTRPPSRSPRMAPSSPRPPDALTTAHPAAWSAPSPVDRSASPPRTRARSEASSPMPTFGSYAASSPVPGSGGRASLEVPPRSPTALSRGRDRPAPAGDAVAATPGRGSATTRVVASAVAVAASVVVAYFAGIGSAVVLLAAGVGILLVARASRRRSASRLRSARASAAPAVIDLLGACLLAGLNPYRSLVRVAERGPEVLRAELARAAVDLDTGSTPAAALRAVGERTGLDELRAAAGALEAAERWGAPPAEALAARAEALRGRARLRAEAEAGRAAVRLAFPLVFCFLPAFVLLVVVPTMVGALRTLAP